MRWVSYPMKRRSRRKKPAESGSPAWMTTYSELVTLLLCFFVLLYSMSQIDVARFEAVAESFRNRPIFFEGSSAIDFDYTNENATIRDRGDIEDLAKDHFDVEAITSNERSLESLLSEVEGFLEEHNLQEVISANRTAEGIVLILQERILFDTSEATIKAEAEPFLDKIALLLENIPNEIRVEGHTDNRQISTTQYPSNWELSGARASSTIRHLVEIGGFDQDRFTSVGYDETRPIAPNDSEENWQKNRRVEIVILKLS